ncbi:DUF4214 domain-containing protein [Stutzerimonas zhaodongensis]|uniref:DUF4214 domain-containing protein n=1 Tax=Stutzerimonas zhaodongensis TaxID=1176257 RepID=UPI0015EF400D|nr:DUF4214 domain-containing protein [Stutzerimonas zhaodongensis]
MNREITELGAYPYRAVAHLYVTFPDGSVALGTGAVVGRNDVLTATHVVYNPDAGGWATDLKLAVGVDYNSRAGAAETRPLTRLDQFEWRINAFPARTFTDDDHRTLTLSESQYDVALIGLSEAVGDQVGYFGVASGYDAPQTAYQIGYPGGSTGMMYGAVQVERNATYGVYHARASETNELMGPGSSGGPLFVWQDETAMVIGVRSSGSSTSAYWADIGFTYASLNDSIIANDTLLGPAAGRLIAGSAGADILHATAGLDRVEAGAGLDTLIYPLSHEHYRIWIDETTVQVARPDMLADSDVLIDVERLRFDDGVLALDVGAGETAGSAYRLYQAAFDRQPEQDGLAYWIELMDAGLGSQEVASRFVGSREFGGLYGIQPTAEILITGYYQNVLDRAPEASGYTYWQGRMEAGLDAAEMLVLFSESNENLIKTAGMIDEGIWLG